MFRELDAILVGSIHMMPGKQIGWYKLLDLLGTGGMAKVYLAEDQRLGRKVALKMLPADAVQNPERVRRFEQEARAASALNHPNILTIFDIGDVDATKFIATEFVEGVTVRELVSAKTPLLKVLDVGLQAAAALAAAHAAGIIHRDIKPENIMVRPDGYVKVLDFGLAKLSQKSLESLHGEQTLDCTMPGMIMGTLGYMSPEQLRGQDVDARTDVWSLGAVLYELATGNGPFAAATPTDTMVAVLERDPPPLRTPRNDAPEELERILAKALAKDREERYQTVKDLAIDLRRLKQRLESDEQQRRTGNLPEPEATQPAAARRRVGLFAGLLVLAIVGTITVFTVAFLRHPERSSPENNPSQAEPRQAPAASPPNTGRQSEGKPDIAVPVPPGIPGLAGGTRELAYSLQIQKMRGGKPNGTPFLSTGKDALESGSKFKVVLSSPQSGYFYLIDQPQEGDPVILFPLPSVNHGDAAVPANKAFEIGWYKVDQIPGKENLWMIWSALPVTRLQVAGALANGVAKHYTGGEGVAQIRQFLQQHQNAANQSTARASGKQVKVSSHSDPLVAVVELQHR